ncbi:MAG: Uma2 family endonuclease [Bacteroidales bacterium]|nr:Uma2 family endonuclease [Bacteroidales bacterium]MCF8455458.1 Uma2 family endonuclease [Bacteroidales bacterium]
MNAIKEEQKIYSFQDYLKLEEQSQEKHDFFFGEVYNMAGGTLDHNEIILALARAFYNSLSHIKCKTYANEVRLELKANEFYVYPDVLVTCDKNDLSNKESVFIQNPSIIVEVLSDCTELYDRNIKKHYYLKLPSLKYYLLVSQNETKVEMFEKIENRIEYSFYENPDEFIEFQQLGFNIKVTDIFGLPF